MSRLASLATVLAVAVVTAGCGGASSSVRRSQAGAAPPTSEASLTDAPSAVPSPSQSPPQPAAGRNATRYKYVFPVLGKVSYAHTHHDYPASDIMAPCGATAVSPVNGTVLEVSRVDTYDPKVNAGATRGGLSVSVLGEDGARYYGSHFASIDAGVDAGTRVTAGQPIAVVGKTGDASACHEHFGISPACARTGDWWTRRGTIWPWPYLDSWRAGTGKSPVAEVSSWQASHGCPTQP
jgi:murein DD-endopeptidase MepM/ murein hydrolase activator NlpD